MIKFCTFFHFISRYANRAKNIKNKPKINEDPKDAMLREYQQEIEKLRAMVDGGVSVGKNILIFSLYKN